MEATKLTIEGPDFGPVGMLGLGVFDGFHLGHQALAQHCDSLLSIFPHPREILFQESRHYLMLKNERNWFYQKTYVLSFCLKVASLSPGDFLDLLYQYLRPSGFVVGYDFHFGASRKGTPDYLSAWCQEKGIECKIIPAFSTSNLVVKSGLIRSMIQEGKFNQAIKLLGHPYCLTGTVIHGDKRGAKLGFPTANLQIDPLKCLFKPGVYLAKWHDKNKEIPAIVYLGSKPTFAGKQNGVEVHIPNFSGDLYGKVLRLSVYQHIRDDQLFESKEALISQIKQDISLL